MNPLSAGDALGPFTLVEIIGEGGMGVVWKARDEGLNREVALKVLPESVASDGDRMARFDREARLLASVDHPNIAAIYGVHQEHGIRFLTMQLVPGEDLFEVLRRGPLDLDRSLELADAIASALAAAHARGVVHRDLKPANIRVTPEGDVKLLDFGLAKALEDEPSPGRGRSISGSLPTRTSAGTLAGTLLGTAAYMSPEQARGRDTDTRSDVWAFGCVLYEMLAGKPAFEGETLSDTVASVLRSEPDWAALPANTPPPVRRLLRRCLAKDPGVRLRDLEDARLELRDAGEGVVEAPPPAAPATAVRASRAGVLAVALAVAVLAVAAAAWMLWTPGAGGGAPAFDLAVTVPEGAVLDGGPENLLLDLSPDGTRVVFAAAREGAQKLYLRSLDNPVAVALPRTDGADSPFFSPDGQWVAFFSGGKLWKINARGGAPVELCEANNDRGGAWLPDGMLVISPTFSSALAQVPAEGGALQPLTRLESGERTHRWPSAVRDTDWILFTMGTVDNPGRYDDSRIDAFHRGTGARKEVLQGASMARFFPPDRLLFFRAGVLHEAPFDPVRAEVTGSAEPLVEGVAGEPTSGAAHFAVSSAGVFAYAPGTIEEPLNELVWLDPSGRLERIRVPPRTYTSPNISEDGSRILLTIGPGSGNGDVWVYDFTRRTLSRVTFEGSSDTGLWIPGTEDIVYSALSSSNELRRTTLGGGGRERTLVKGGLPLVPSDVSSDGQWVVFSEFGSGKADIQRVSTDGGEPESLVSDPFAKWGGVVSPEGSWLAYVSDESGRNEVYVQAYPASSGKWQVSNEGGEDPLWSPAGGELFYRKGRSLMAVSVETEAGRFIPGAPRKLVELPPIRRMAFFRNHAIDPGGSRFLVIQDSSPRAPRTRIHVAYRDRANL